MFIYPLTDLDDVTIELVKGTNISGGPNVIATLDTKVTFNHMSKTKHLSNGKDVTIVGMIFKKGDIFTGHNVVEGQVKFAGKTYKLSSFNRLKDPFGNVHHVEIEVV